MLDVTEQLRRYGEAVTATVDPVRADEVDSVATEPSRMRRPVWQPLLGAAAAVAFAAGGLWVATSSPGPSSSRPDITTGARAGVELLDPGPLAPRADAAVVWTGDELLVWGGDIEAANLGLPGPDRAFGDGAAYNPETRQWRRIADGPLPTNMDGVSAVATDQGVVVVRGVSVALWDPDTDSWRKLDDTPGSIDPGAAADLEYTGAKVLSVGANAALDLQTGHWESLPEPPLKLDLPVAVWTGTQLVVVGSLGSFTAGSTTGAQAFDPERRTWRALPAPPDLNPAAISGSLDGDRIVYVDYEMHVVSYRRDGNTDSWQVLPSVPARFYEDSPTIAAVPPALIVRTASAIVIRTGDGPWIPVPHDALTFWAYSMPVAPASSARERASLFVFGMSRPARYGTPTGENRFALVDPEHLARSARTLQVGVVSVQLPDSVELAHSGYDDTPGREQVSVELRSPTGTCNLISGYGRMGAESRWAPANSDGLVWFAQATTSDFVRLTCQDAATAQQIAGATKLPTPAR